MASPAFFAAPNRMCWLCRRESEILRYNHTRNPRSSLFRKITLHPADAEEKATASISAILNQPESILPCQDGARAKLPLHTEESKSGVCQADNQLYDPSSQTWTFQVHADCWDLVACRVSEPVRFATAWCSALISSRTASPQHPLRCSSLRSTIRLPSHGKNYRRVGMQRVARFDDRLAAELGLARLPTVHQPIPLSDLGLLHYQQPPPPYRPPTASVTRLPPGNTKASTSFDTTTPSKHQTHYQPTSTPPLAAAIIAQQEEDDEYTTDAFRLLPPELIHHILTHTRTRDLPSLRLASRYVACLSHPACLPQAFWRSRFELPRGEMGFAMPGPGPQLVKGIVTGERKGDDGGDGDDVGEGEAGEGSEALGLKGLDWRGMYFLLRRALISPPPRGGGGQGWYGGGSGGALVRQGLNYQVQVQERGGSLLARLAKRWYWWERLGSVVEIYG